MKVCVLASGSKGNSTYIETRNSKILIDIGMNAKYIEEKLREIKVEPSEINAIYITHTHKDHISGLRVFIKRYKTKVYLTEKMLMDLDFELENYEFIEKEKQENDYKIYVVKTSHDVSDSNAYIVESDNKSVVYITDTGYINSKNHQKLSSKNLYIIESNYDLNTLINGKYPYHLRKRIISDKGHLSNEESAKYITNFISKDTKTIVLAHLSEENNTKEKALLELNKALNKENKKLQRILVASQNERTELIEV